MKLLIVDDEVGIRQSMANYFQAADFGFSDVLSAEDGESALRLVEQHRPDVILSDVVMPGMSGLEFVQQAKEIHADCEVLMISGHEESAYIRQALRFEAVDYLLKPIDIDELDRVVGKIVDRVQARRSEAAAWQRMMERMQASRELWLGKLFEALCDGAYESREDIRQQIAYWGLDLDVDQPVVVVYMGTDQPDDDGDFRERQLARLMLLSSVENHAKALGLRSLHALYGADLLGVIANTPGGTLRDVVGMARAVQADIGEKLHGAVAVGVGFVAPDAFDLRHSCKGARAALLEAAQRQHDRLALASELAADALQFSPVSDALQWMQGLFENANPSLLRKLISESYADWLRDKAASLQAELTERKAITSRHMADIAMGIIQARYQTPINLQTVADEIGVTPNYLGALFKDVCGENFTVVLTRKRLDAAVELLEKSDEPIVRIAEITGFGDCNYFGKVFKKAYALSPGAYRRRLQV